MSGVSPRSLRILFLACAVFTCASTVWAAETDGVYPLPEAELLRRLRDLDFRIVSSEATGAGVMGAKKLTLRFDDGVTIHAKWKVTSAAGDGWNNSPRREIGAYAVQSLFLAPENYLVPVPRQYSVRRLFELRIAGPPIAIAPVALHPPAMLRLFQLLLWAVRALACSRQALVLDNLALRHQLATLAHRRAIVQC